MKTTAPIGTNILLRSMQGCTVKDISYLGQLMNDESVSAQVRKRAHFKFAMLWAESDRRKRIVQKAQATRKANKVKELARIAAGG